MPIVLDSRIWHRSLISLFVVSVQSWALPGQALPRIEKVADLPAYTYPTSEPVEQLIRSGEAFEEFSNPVEVDLLRLRSEFEIQNEGLRSRTLELLAKLDLLFGHYESGISRVQQLRAMQSKVGARLTKMLTEEAYMRAARSAYVTSGPQFVALYRDYLNRAIALLPYEEAWANLVEIRAYAEPVEMQHYIAYLSQRFEPFRKKSGTLGREGAWEIIEARSAFVLANIGETTKVTIRKVEIDHGGMPAGIWSQRAAVLEDRLPYSPVTVAIWDSGIDARLFPGRMWTDKSDPAVHGIAFDTSGQRTAELLRPLTAEEKQRSGFLSALNAGQLEDFFEPESSNAQQYRGAMKNTPATKLRHLIDEMEDFRIASHGTMCAFSAAQGNPYIRLLSARTMGDPTNDTKLTHQAPSVAHSKQIAKSFMNLVDFFQEHNVRVVNISWGIFPREFNEAAERYGNESNQARREAEARAAFEAEKRGLYDAMSGARSILFVAASGNLDEDVAAAEIMPQSFNLPNLIKVGAVDPVGNAASFTTFGTSVDIYADGFQKAPLLGGQLCGFRGTSAAAPAIVNLAAKILAIQPALSPVQVIDLVKRGGSRNEEGLLVANPKRSLDLLGTSGRIETGK